MEINVFALMGHLVKTVRDFLTGNNARRVKFAADAVVLLHNGLHMTVILGVEKKISLLTLK